MFGGSVLPPRPPREGDNSPRERLHRASNDRNCEQRYEASESEGWVRGLGARTSGPHAPGTVPL
jgi:hypothetical protein